MRVVGESTGGAAALLQPLSAARPQPRGSVLPARAAEAGICDSRSALDRLYKATSTYFANDPQWVAWTRPRLTWPKAGEKVPELTVVISTVQGAWLDAWRKWAADGAKLGLKYNIQQVSEARWIDLIVSHKHGDIEMHSAILRPERVDPAEWLVSRAYGLDRRNYGEWANEQYDALIDAQAKRSDARQAIEVGSGGAAHSSGRSLHHLIRLGPGRSSRPITARPGKVSSSREASASVRSTRSTLSYARKRRRRGER